MTILPDTVLDALAESTSVTMASTVDSQGKPNTVVISTIAVVDLETLAFADACLGKTKVNLKETGKLTVTVVTSQGTAHQIQCTFVHFDNKTPLFDTWHEAVWQKMSIQIKGVGIAKVDNVSTANL